MFIYTKRSPC